MVLKGTLVISLNLSQAEQKKEIQGRGGGLKGGAPPYVLSICLSSQKYGQVPKTNILVCLEKP